MQNSIRDTQKILIGLCLLVSACDRGLPSWNTGNLAVIVPEAAEGAKAEFERDLAQLFAGQLHVTLQTISVPQNQVVAALNDHRAHFAAVPLRSEVITGKLLFSPSYQSVRELVVCNRDRPVPRTLQEMDDRKLAVIAGSAQEKALREAIKTFPHLQWHSRQGLSSNDLLGEVAEGIQDCAVADELQLADARNFHPNLVAVLDIAPPSRLAWGFPADVDPELLTQAQTFFARIEQDGTLDRLMERYYGHNNRLDRMDAAAFVTAVKTVLPHFRRVFEEAASVTGLDWRLLAALAYQESQWDPLASSHTYVRGMMMLTEETADQLNVNNRLDARESIMAGARYLVVLRDKIPARIPEPDRTWMALAAYNQGFGHLEDARILTERAGQSPDSWSDVKKWMPMLNRQAYYRTLARGYARGGEAVILVENIRNYYDMLKRMKPATEPSAMEEISYRLIEPLQRILPGG